MFEAADALAAIDDEGGEAAHAVVQRLPEAPQRCGVEERDLQPVPVALARVEDPVRDLRVLLLQLRRLLGASLLSAPALAQADPVPDDLAVLAVEELGRGGRKYFQPHRPRRRRTLPALDGHGTQPSCLSLPTRLCTR